MRGSVKFAALPRGLTTGSIKTIKNTNNFSIFNWIPWSSHGVTQRILPNHAIMPSRNDRKTKPCNNTELGMASADFNNAISEPRHDIKKYGSGGWI
ncbi:hypothetical protein O6R16_06640 [Candidatus Rickettsia tasmanensis]